MKNKMLIIITITIFFLTNITSILSIDAYNFKDDITESSSFKTGVTIYTENCCEGYTLCSVIPFMMIGDNRYALLIDMNGTEINRWITMPDPAKMLPGGSIVSATGEYYNEWDNTNLTQQSWDGEVEWDFSKWVQDENGRYMAREHHDFQREGNPVGYYAPSQEFVSNGKTLILAHNTTIDLDVSKKTIISDVIYEVFWNGTLTGFEWHSSDHIDEMGFNKISRIGIWLNPGGPGLILFCLPGDWIHINSMSKLGKNRFYDNGDERFNPENIIISSRHASFIAIISRETGEIVWRVGPYYTEDTEEGRKLGNIVGLHHAHMIPDGLPGAGNILLFDNGGFAGYGLFGFPSQIRFYSRVIEFDPITLEIKQEYVHKEGFNNKIIRNGDYHKFYSATMSSVQRLPNGNTMITESLSGRIFEITSENEIVWDYVLPNPTQLIYRAYRIPPEWVPGNPSNYTFWEEN